MLDFRRALNDPERCQDVVSHRLIFCETAQCMPTEELLLDCWCCDRFFAYCCACTERQRLRSAEASRRRYRSTFVNDDEPPPNRVIVTKSRSSMVHVWETVSVGRRLALGLRSV